MRHFCKFCCENNQLVCYELVGNREITKREIDARMDLRKIDKENFTKVQVSSKRILLKNERYNVSITDIDAFYNAGYFELLPRTLPKIEKAITRYQRAQTINTMFDNIKKKRSKIIAGGLVLALLSLGTVKLVETVDLENEAITSEINDENDMILSDITNNVNKMIEEEFPNNDSEMIQDELYNIVLETMKESTSDIEINTLHPEDSEEIVVDNDYENYNEDEESINAYLAELEKLDNTLEKDEINVMGSVNNAATQTTFLEFAGTAEKAKFDYVYNTYYNIVHEYSEKWGISPNIIMGILTQESGGQEVNLMQISFNEWANQIFRVYNFKENKYEQFVLTNAPQEFAGSNITCITEEDLKNPITNISVACILFRKAAETTNYHVGAAIQCNNMGSGNMQTILQLTSQETNTPVEELLNDQTNLQFADYTNIIEVGDPQYINRVVEYAVNYYPGNQPLTIKYYGSDGVIHENSIYIEPNEKIVSFGK